MQIIINICKHVFIRIFRNVLEISKEGIILFVLLIGYQTQLAPIMFGVKCQLSSASTSGLCLVSFSELLTPYTSVRQFSQSPEIKYLNTNH